MPFSSYRSQARSTATLPSALEGHSTFERIEVAARIATQAPMQGNATRGILRSVAGVLFAWRERRFVSSVCREMLRLHAETASRHPELRGRPLYHRIVAARNGGSKLLADAILDRAGQSFAEWPTSRPLNYRDVVHYVAVLEFVATKRSAHWIHADLKRLVSEAIPRAL
jgi:hypothetical protein